jgi:hypothetical protein
MARGRRRADAEARSAFAVSEQFNDFRNVMYVVWRHLGLPSPTKVQYDIAEWLQRGPSRSVTEAFRGVGKSWIASAFVVDALRHVPDLNIMVVSAAKIRADDFSIFTKRLINEVEMFHHLQPREDQRQSNVAFDVGPAKASHAPSVKSVGITGQITGSRADIIIADDVEVANNSATQLQREKLAEAIKEFEAVLKPVPSDEEIARRYPHLPVEFVKQYLGRIIFLGTPQTEQSIYNLLPERGYSTRIWPVRYPDPKTLAFYGDKLAPSIAGPVEKDPDIAGNPTDPQRFNEWELGTREASYGRSGFALQFMLDTSMSDANKYPLKLADLIVMDVDTDVAPEKVVWSSGPDVTIKDLPCVGFSGDRFHRPMAVVGDMQPYSGKVMAIDPSGRGADELAYCITGVVNSMIYCPLVKGLRGGYNDENLKQIAEDAKKHKVNHILVEENFGDGMFSTLLRAAMRNIYPVTIEEVKHSKQKELRIIDTLEPVMNQHRLVMSASVIKDDAKVNLDDGVDRSLTYSLFYQLTRLTRERGCLVHDDRLDALAMSVGYWATRVGASVDEAIEAERQARADREIEAFLDSWDRMHGGVAAKKAPRWIHEPVVLQVRRPSGG